MDHNKNIIKTRLDMIFAQAFIYYTPLFFFFLFIYKLGECVAILIGRVPLENPKTNPFRVRSIHLYKLLCACVLQKRFKTPKTF